MQKYLLNGKKSEGDKNIATVTTDQFKTTVTQSLIPIILHIKHSNNNESFIARHDSVTHTENFRLHKHKQHQLNQATLYQLPLW